MESDYDEDSLLHTRYSIPLSDRDRLRRDTSMFPSLPHSTEHDVGSNGTPRPRGESFDVGSNALGAFTQSVLPRSSLRIAGLGSLALSDSLSDETSTPRLLDTARSHLGSTRGDTSGSSAVGGPASSVDSSKPPRHRHRQREIVVEILQCFDETTTSESATNTFFSSSSSTQTKNRPSAKRSRGRGSEGDDSDMFLSSTHSTTSSTFVTSSARILNDRRLGRSTSSSEVVDDDGPTTLSGLPTLQDLRVAWNEMASNSRSAFGGSVSSSSATSGPSSSSSVTDTLRQHEQSLASSNPVSSRRRRRRNPDAGYLGSSEYEYESGSMSSAIRKRQFIELLELFLRQRESILRPNSENESDLESKREEVNVNVNEDFSIVGEGGQDLDLGSSLRRVSLQKRFGISLQPETSTSTIESTLSSGSMVTSEDFYDSIRTGHASSSSISSSTHNTHPPDSNSFSSSSSSSSSSLQETIDALSAIFDEIDFDNTGSVTFDNFVTFLISVAKSTSSDDVSWYKSYKFRGVIRSPGISDENVHKMVYVPGLDKLVLCGRTRRVKIVDPVDKAVENVLTAHEGTVLTAEYIPKYNILATSSSDLSVKFWDIADDHRCTWSMDCKRTGSQSVLCWSPYHDCLLSASRTGRLLVWKWSEIPNVQILVKREKVKVQTEKKFVFVADEGAAFAMHRDIVTGMLVIPKDHRLVTCSLDSVIKIWETRREDTFSGWRVDTSEAALAGSGSGGNATAVAAAAAATTASGVSLDQLDGSDDSLLIGNTPNVPSNVLPTSATASSSSSSLKLVGSLQRHKKGVFCIAWSEDHSFLLSGGFEPEAYVWISNIKAEPFRLHDQRKPHNTSLIHVEVVPNSPQIITADIKGLVKIWDIRTFQCLQTFSYDNGGSGFGGGYVGVFNSAIARSSSSSTGSVSVPIAPPALQAVCYVAKTKQIVTAGRRVCVFEYDRTRHPTFASDELLMHAHYCPTTFSFITASKSEIRIWDARTGQLQRVYTGLTKSEMTAFAVDETGRKFFVGTHDGKVHCFQFSNGVFVKSYTLHQDRTTGHRGSGSSFLSRQRRQRRRGRHGSRSRNSHVSTSGSRSRDDEDSTPMGDDESRIREVTSLTYCGDRGSDDDRVKTLKLIATTWQTGVYILNDNDPNEGTVARSLASTEHVTYHRNDVKCSHYSPHYRLFVTGDETGRVIIWEIDTMTLQTALSAVAGVGDRRDAATTRPALASGEITAIRFLWSYPAFIFADSSGYLHLWRLKPDVIRIVSWRNFNETTKFDTAVTAIDFDFQTKYLFTGDERGFVCVWDLEKVLNHAQLRPKKASRLPVTATGASSSIGSSSSSSTANGDASGSSASSTSTKKKSIVFGTRRRRAPARRPTSGTQSSSVSPSQAQQQGSKRNRHSDFLDPLSSSSVPRCHFWRAHATGVKNIQIIANPVSLLSASVASEVRIWRLDGDEMDSLRQESTVFGDQHQNRFDPHGGSGGPDSLGMVPRFNFPLDERQGKTETFEVAEAIVNVYRKLAFINRWKQRCESGEENQKRRRKRLALERRKKMLRRRGKKIHRGGRLGPVGDSDSESDSENEEEGEESVRRRKRILREAESGYSSQYSRKRFDRGLYRHSSELKRQSTPSILTEKGDGWEEDEIVTTPVETLEERDQSARFRRRNRRFGLVNSSSPPKKLGGRRRVTRRRV